MEYMYHWLILNKDILAFTKEEWWEGGLWNAAMWIFTCNIGISLIYHIAIYFFIDDTSWYVRNLKIYEKVYLMLLSWVLSNIPLFVIFFILLNQNIFAVQIIIVILFMINCFIGIAFTCAEAAEYNAGRANSIRLGTFNIIGSVWKFAFDKAVYNHDVEELKSYYNNITNQIV
jgi:hypothetical protein